MKTAFTFLKRFFFTLLILVALAASFQYLYCPVYIFSEPKPFSGDKIYNPYANMDSTCWKKANFHLHTRQWGGITDGRKNSVEAADSMYRFLNYDIIGISDYQHINYYREKEEGFIPEYEHGYMLPKNHQIVMGAKNVCWLDYPFPQTLNNKQHIIKVLKEGTSDIVAVAHPHMIDAYSLNDFRFLSDYDCIEVFDRIIYSVAYWDSALSTGHQAYATSVDDTHDINDFDEVAINFTLVNTKDMSAPSILNSLKKGQMIACEMPLQRQNDFEKKRIAVSSLPIINNILFKNNQLIISSNTSMKYLYFIGQGGIIKKTVTDSKDAVYDFKPEDTYIRSDIHFSDSTVYHLNPVFRFNGEMSKPGVVINSTSTTIRRIFFYISLFVILFVLYLSVKKKKA